MTTMSSISVFLFCIAVSLKSYEVSCEPTVMYMGCYQGNSLSVRAALASQTSLTPELCNKDCLGIGYPYAGTTNGFQCFCSQNKPPDKKKIEESNCSTRCPGDGSKSCGGSNTFSVYFTKTHQKQSPGDSKDDGWILNSSVGCFKDSFHRIFSGPQLGLLGLLTNEKCIEHCSQKGFNYAGTELGMQCFCGHDKPRDDLKLGQEKCHTPCLGDPNQKCGGLWRLSVYSAVTLPASIGGATEVLNSFRCYRDSRQNRVLPYRNRNVNHFPFTNQKCVNSCALQGYSYAGTESGRQCYCGHTEPSVDLAVGPENCNKPCIGDIFNSNVRCGGHWHIAVFSIKNIPQTTVTPVDYPTQKPCDTSVTVVTGEDEVCTGAIIFEDQFKIPLSYNNRWKHVVMIPDSELEFVVFNSNPKNSFTSETNGLVIKPTVFNDSFVQTGSFILKGCTEKRRELCIYESTVDNILPPVESARLQTRESFSFRYGIVEIRAKLPIGDWLVPELWLEPQNRIYGPAYASGRIRVAMNRGNVNFKCNSEDLGSNFLESGVVMGVQNDVRRRSLMTKLPSNWHSSFHNYTLKWTPDKISFQVDNEPPQELLGTSEKGKRLCEVVGFENSDCVTWNSGSKIAPFDQDFYISLGLTVGNARDFPDECTNNGKPKPWRNSDSKAMLKFWQDRKNWKETWTDENSSLYVQHIRVTAL